jgi:hypothetical protein
MAKSINELSETNAALHTQFGYREKYWLQEVNVAKARILELEAKCDNIQHDHDSQQSELATLESKHSRLFDIRNRLLSKLTSSVRMCVCPTFQEYFLK